MMNDLDTSSVDSNQAEIEYSHWNNVNDFEEQSCEEYNDKIRESNDNIEKQKGTDGYGASWLLGVLTGAVSVGMLVVASILIK